MAAFSGEIIGGEKINCKNAAGMQPAASRARCPFVFQDDLWSVSVCEPATKKMSDKVGSSSAPLRLRKFYFRMNSVIFNLKLMKSQITFY